jgi:hypothetical protein
MEQLRSVLGELVWRRGLRDNTEMPRVYRLFRVSGRRNEVDVL